MQQGKRHIRLNCPLKPDFKLIWTDNLMQTKDEYMGYIDAINNVKTAQKKTD